MSQTLSKSLLSGVVLLDKPLGLTSNQVLQKVKHLFGAQKAGHTGSLDPLATGMLPICLGEATKFSQYLLDADKCYTVTACLGVKTSTADREGEVIATAPVPIFTTTELLAVLARFTGSISQIPSMYSALKHQGKPLYTFARQGVVVERAARPITIYVLDLLAADLPYITLRVVCSKGTYIRNLVEDIGDALGTGAHVTMLHRDWVAGLANYAMFSLPELAALAQTPALLYQRLQSFEILLAGIAAQLMLSDDEVMALYYGKKLPPPPGLPVSGPIRLYDAAQQCIGLGQVVDQQLQVLRLVARQAVRKNATQSYTSAKSELF